MQRIQSSLEIVKCTCILDSVFFLPPWLCRQFYASPAVVAAAVFNLIVILVSSCCTVNIRQLLSECLKLRLLGLQLLQLHPTFADRIVTRFSLRNKTISFCLQCCLFLP